MHIKILQEIRVMIEWCLGLHSTIGLVKVNTKLNKEINKKKSKHCHSFWVIC